MRLRARHSKQGSLGRNCRPQVPNSTNLDELVARRPGVRLLLESASTDPLPKLGPLERPPEQGPRRSAQRGRSASRAGSSSTSQSSPAACQCAIPTAEADKPDATRSSVHSTRRRRVRFGTLRASQYESPRTVHKVEARSSWPTQRQLDRWVRRRSSSRPVRMRELLALRPPSRSTRIHETRCRLPAKSLLHEGQFPLEVQKARTLSLQC